MKKPFARLFESEKYGQILVIFTDAGDEPTITVLFTSPLGELIDAEVECDDYERYNAIIDELSLDIVERIVKEGMDEFFEMTGGIS